MAGATWNPGGRSARSAGCTCSVEYNWAGGRRPPDGWAVALDCPIHGVGRDLADGVPPDRTDLVIIEP